MQAFMMRSWDEWRRYVKASGLSMPQFGTLMHLRHVGPCGVSEVGCHMEVSSAAASQLVDRLVHQGLVERREDPRDRRVRTLSLTSRGEAMIEQAMEERLRWADSMAAGLSEESRKALAAALPALVEATRAIPAESSENARSGTC
jgi:DNA-binding MarR family transcriptional regulator